MLVALQADVAVLRKKTEFALNVGDVCCFWLPLRISLTKRSAAVKERARGRRTATGRMHETGGASDGTSDGSQRAAMQWYACSL